jgi:hypothetical protein
MFQKFLLFILIIGVLMHAGAQSTPGEDVSSKIAQRMKDTLALSDSQKVRLYNINQDLHNKKMAVRAQGSTSFIGDELQAVENTRDSLYKGVLSPDQYLLYRKKKNRLVNNN